jgi:Protein of unknown function (DUF3500)
MRHRAIIASILVLIGGWCGFSVIAQSNPDPAQDKVTSEVVAAAKKFLATLDDAQRGKVLFDFNDETQRKRWSNLPSGAFQRAGLRMGDLTPPQREAALAVLASALSKQGYDKVSQIVEADETLRATEGRGRGGPGGGGPGGNGPGGGGPRGRGGPGGGASFGRDNYYISFLGQPSDSEAWMIQFGGHHLGLNITLAGHNGTLAPTHTGAQPASYEVEGKTVRPLGREADEALALVNSLDEAQRKQAVLGFQIRDLVLGPGQDGKTIQPEGIKGSDLSEKQLQMLAEIANEWIGIQNEAIATAKMTEVKKNIAETWFAWSGPIDKAGGGYFRIQGPTVFIEFAPQRLGGDPTNHIHTVYRDPTNDYGRAPVKK